MKLKLHPFDLPDWAILVNVPQNPKQAICQVLKQVKERVMLKIDRYGNIPTIS